jgi:hypothetical protein
MHSLKREEVRKKRLPPLTKGRALGGVSGIFARVLLLVEIENLTNGGGKGGGYKSRAVPIGSASGYFDKLSNNMDIHARCSWGKPPRPHSLPKQILSGQFR